jgi:hypothetical protein
MIFEIELNPKFKILDSHVYLSEGVFLEYCKNNNIQFPKNRLNEEEIKKYLFKNLYPDWLLFTSSGWFPRDCVDAFKYIAEIRYNKNNEKHLFHSKFNAKKCSHCLGSILHFYQRLKDDEKYKLMWNLEVYIIELIEILLSKNNSKDKEEIKKKIYTENEGGTYSGLHEIDVYKKLYIEQSKSYFTNEVIMPKFKKSIEKDILSDEIMKTLQVVDKYQDTLFSIIELTKRLNANKKSETILGAMVKGIVLGVEEYIVDKFKENFFDSLMKLSDNQNELKLLRNKINDKDPNDLFLCKLENIILKKEDSLNKYLIIYYHARNYLAHNNIDMNQFFHGRDKDRIIVGSVIDAVIIIIYLLSKDKV